MASASTSYYSTGQPERMLRRLSIADIQSKKITLTSWEVEHYIYACAPTDVKTLVEKEGNRLQIALREIDCSGKLVQQYQGPGNYLKKVKDNVYDLGLEDVVDVCEPSAGSIVFIKYDTLDDDMIEVIQIFLPTC